MLASKCAVFGLKLKPVLCGKEKLIHMGGWGGVFVVLLLDLEKLVVNQ